MSHPPPPPIQQKQTMSHYPAIDHNLISLRRCFNNLVTFISFSFENAKSYKILLLTENVFNYFRNVYLIAIWEVERILYQSSKVLGLGEELGGVDMLDCLSY